MTTADSKLAGLRLAVPSPNWSVARGEMLAKSAGCNGVSPPLSPAAQALFAACALHAHPPMVMVMTDHH